MELMIVLIPLTILVFGFIITGIAYAIHIALVRLESAKWIKKIRKWSKETFSL